MNTEKAQASRTTFERIVFALNAVSREEGGDDTRTYAQLFARDPNDDDDYLENDISAIWFGWRLHLNYLEFEAHEKAHGHNTATH